MNQFAYRLEEAGITVPAAKAIDPASPARQQTGGGVAKGTSAVLASYRHSDHEQAGDYEDEEYSGDYDSGHDGLQHFPGPWM